MSGFAAEWGVADLNGAQLAIDEINSNGGIHGKKLQLIVEDTASDGTRTVSAVQKLINVDNVDFIIGPTWLDSYTGAAPLADQYEIIMITPSASITAVQSEEQYQYVFSTWFRSDKEAEDLVQYLANARQNKIVLFFGNDPFWQDAAKIIKETAQIMNVEIVGDYQVNPNDIDFRTQLSQIAALQPDVIIFGFNNENQFASFLRQRQEVYPESQLFTTEYVEEFALNANYQSLLVGTRFIAPKVEINDFTEKYRERFGSDPVFGASNSYDAIKIIVKALEFGQTDSSDIREYIRSNIFNTVTFGETKFDEIGGVKGGEFVINEITEEGIRIIQEL